jgi:hypothetical protein
MNTLYFPTSLQGVGHYSPYGPEAAFKALRLLTSVLWAHASVI